MDVEIKVNFTGSQIDQAKTVFGLDRESKDRKIWFGISRACTQTIPQNE